VALGEGKETTTFYGLEWGKGLRGLRNLRKSLIMEIGCARARAGEFKSIGAAAIAVASSDTRPTHSPFVVSTAPQSVRCASARNCDPVPKYECAAGSDYF